MSRYSSHDDYLDPASGVLRNRFGITDEATLQSTEADLVAARSRELAVTPLNGGFDLPHLQAIHRYLFGDLYEWAGQLRTVDIAKGNNGFAHHAHLSAAAETIFRQLADERHLVGLDATGFSERSAHYLGEINALHSFREGNGRTQREFISHLAHTNYYYLAWENTSPPEVLQAAIESFSGKTARLATIIRENLSHITTEDS